jgi:hypothetical protein
VPKQRRNRPPRIVGLLWIVSIFIAGTFATTLGSGIARAEEEPTASEEPSPTPPAPQCGPADSAGLLPAGNQTISGTVTNASGNPLTDLQVRISTTGSKADEVLTNAEGHYIFQGLGNGSYLISFFDQNAIYQSGFYDGASGLALTPLDATLIQLTGTSATSVDAELSAESLHTTGGLVTQFGGAPLTDALVTVRSAYFPMEACSQTTGDGTYSLIGVRTGAYRLEITRNGYPTGFYRQGATGNFTTHFSEATVLRIDADLTGINVDFPQLFSLSGIVADAADNPKGGFYVGAGETVQGASGYGFSDELGQFTIGGLPAGEYVVNYSDSNQVYANGWYAGDGEISPTRDGAATVTVPGPSIELLADPAPTITGTIRNAASALLEFVQVNLCERESGNCYSGTTGLDGRYTASILEPGTYTAQVWDNTSTYPSGGYIQPDGSIGPDFDAALEIPMTGSDVENVNGTLPDGGQITATLTSGGGPLPYPYVSFCRSEYACGDSNVTSDEFGNATSPVLFVGTYFVQDGGTGAWLVDGAAASSQFDNATPVIVMAGLTSTIVSDIPAPGAPTDAGDGVAPVTVELADNSGGNAPPVTVMFSDVTASGTTTLTTSDSGQPVPDGFQLGLPAIYYDISTTAEYTVPITVCISYAGIEFANGVGLTLYHYDSTIPGWDPITTEVRTGDQVICGETNSLSPFVIVEAVPTFTGFFQPVDNGKLNRVKAGQGVPVKFSLGGDFGLDIFAEGYPVVTTISCAGSTVDAVEETTNVGTSRLVYDAGSNQYVFQFKTQKTWANSCRRLTLMFDDGSSHTADFQLTK